MSDALNLPVALGLAVGALGAFAAGVLAALLERSGPIRLHHWADEAAGRLQRLYESPSRFRLFLFLLSSLAKLLPVVLVAALWLGPVGGDRRSATIALGAVSLLVLVTELVNRRLLAGDREAHLRRLTPVYRGLAFSLWPLILIVDAVTPKGREVEQESRESRPPDDEASDEEIEAFIRVGSREGILEPEEEDLVLRIVDFGDAVVRKVMTPRIDIVATDVHTGLDDLVEKILSSKHSRLPVFEESIDDIVGIVHIRDVLENCRRPQPRPLGELVNSAGFVPETKPLNELLREFQERHQQMAIVVDEYGGTAGLVTVEDLLEEIVGEIADEHEVPALESRRLADGTWLLPGGTHLDELDDLFGVEIEDAPYETVGGLIFSTVGAVPEIGDTVAVHGLEFTVESVDDRRIQTVRVTQREAAEEGHEQA